MHENPETSERPAVKPDTRTAGEGLGRTARMHISEESDSGTVPMNQSNKDEKLLAEIEEGRPLIEENTLQPNTRSTLPVYYGIVPNDFSQRYTKAHVIPQGTWPDRNGFTRPDWLDPRDPLFAKIAAKCYRVNFSATHRFTTWKYSRKGGRLATFPWATDQLPFSARWKQPIQALSG